jgi:hypothetical protein
LTFYVFNIFNLYLNIGFLKVSYIFVFVISLFQIIKNGKQSKSLFVLLLFIFSYYMKIKEYLFDNIQIFNPSSFDEKIYTFRSIFLYEVFFLIFFLFLDIKNFTSFNLRFSQCKKNSLIFFICIIISLLITILAKNGTNLFSSNNSIGYGENEINATGIIEYNVFFFLIAYLFMPKNKFYFIILLFSILFYCIKNILLGGRIETFQVFLVFLFLRLENKINWFFLLFIIFIFYYLSKLYESVRLNPLELFYTPLNEILLGPFYQKKDVSITNQGEIFSATNRLFSLVDVGVLDLKMRILSFFSFLLSIIVPYSFLPDYAVLSKFLSDKYFTLGGSLIPGYLYVWFGFLGLLISSFLLSYLFNYFANSMNKYHNFYALLFFATTPRWFAYNPLSLIKLNFYGLIIFFLFIQLNKYLISIKISKTNFLESR